MSTERVKELKRRRKRRRERLKERAREAAQARARRARISKKKAEAAATAEAEGAQAHVGVGHIVFAQTVAAVPHFLSGVHGVLGDGFNGGGLFIPNIVLEDGDAEPGQCEDEPDQGKRIFHV